MLSQQLFSRAGLAQDAHARFAGRDAIHLRHHASHGLAGVHDLVLAHALPQIAVLVFQALQLEDVVQREQQLVGGERFLQNIHRAHLGGAYGHVDRGLPADHHYWNRDAQIAHVFEQRQPVFAGHHHVGEHHVEGLRAHQLERAAGVVADGRLVSRQAKGASQRGQRVLIVVNDE